MKLNKLFKGKDTYKEEVAEARAIKSGKITPEQYAKGENMEKAKEKKANPFAKAKPFAKGGFVRSADGVAKKGKTKAKQVKMAGGGKC